MLRASRREDWKRVPQYSSSLIRDGSTGIFREVSAGPQPGARWVTLSPDQPPSPGISSAEIYGKGRDTPDRVGRECGWEGR